MINPRELNIDDETISRLGLKRTDKTVHADASVKTRVFEYPQLDNVFIMESDLYGNPMPKDSCFLAFYGQHGLMGKHLKIETLKNSSVEDIKYLVQHNIEG